MNDDTQFRNSFFALLFVRTPSILTGTKYDGRYAGTSRERAWSWLAHEARDSRCAEPSRIRPST